MKIVVVDDMESSRLWLEEKISSYMSNHHLDYDFFSFDSGEAFVNALTRERFDIVFMDIFMEGMSGIVAAQKLREQDMDCRLIFLTVSREHFQIGYSFMPRHYLVKPVKDADFHQAMDNCQIKRYFDVPYLPVICNGEPLRISTAELMYVCVIDRNTFLHMEDRFVAVSGSMRSIIRPLLKDKRFVLCIQGILVNMDYVADVADSFFVLKNGERLQMAVRNKTSLTKKYRNYIFDRMAERRYGL